MLQMALITGPVAMGFLVARLGFVGPYALATGLYLVAIGALSFLHSPPLPAWFKWKLQIQKEIA